MGVVNGYTDYGACPEQQAFQVNLGEGGGNLFCSLLVQVSQEDNPESFASSFATDFPEK